MSPLYWPRPRGVVGPDLRVSDAERSQVADLLSKHFAEGRLDQTEFDERIHGAMSAKTRADLGGLLADLPPLSPPPDATHHHRRGRTVTLLLVTFLFAVAITSGAWAAHWHFPFLLVAIVFLVLWRRSRWAGHRHRRWPTGWEGPVSSSFGDPVAWRHGRRGWWA